MNPSSSSAMAARGTSDGRVAMAAEADCTKKPRRSGVLTEYAAADPNKRPEARRTVYLRFIIKGTLYYGALEWKVEALWV